MEFAEASRFADRHDVVLVGYRGVDGSTVLDCPEVSSALKRSADLLGERSFAAQSRGFEDFASRLRADGVDLAGYSLIQRVDDLEAARRALGYGRIDLLSESAGTRTAQIYSWRHPESIHRSVMLAVNPPGHFLWDAKTIDAQIGQYAELCAKDDACRARTGDLASTVKATAADVPGHWGPLEIKPGNAARRVVLRPDGNGRANRPGDRAPGRHERRGLMRRHAVLPGWTRADGALERRSPDAWQHALGEPLELVERVSA